jgi:hypothetical protein
MLINQLTTKLLIKLVNRIKVRDGDFIRFGDINAWQRNGFSIIPNHYYSPIPNLSTLKPNVFQKESKLTGIDLKIDSQVRLIKKLSKFSKELKDLTYVTPEIDNQKDPKFYFGNMAFDNFDACIYYCLIRLLKSKTVLEVGSGWSTKIAAKAASTNKNTDLISIEPYPQPILKNGFEGLSKLIIKDVQSVPMDIFLKLNQNDILFIDSSHTVKIAGDVNYLFLEVLPRLKKGVYVHIHDIFLPWEYPQEWVKNEFRFWGEQYLLHAFLLFNSSFEVVFSNNFFFKKNPDLVKRSFPVLKKFSSGSFWIRKIK